MSRLGPFIARLRRRARRVIWLAICAGLLGGSTLPVYSANEQVRFFTRAVEFDFIQWTLDAAFLKMTQAALGSGGYLPLANQPDIVRAYITLVQEVARQESTLNQLLAQPAENQPADSPSHQAVLNEARAALADLYARRARLQPLAESIIQNQVSSIAAELGLAPGGQPLPPVLYHTTPPPSALVVSPRDAIRMDHDISVSPNLTVEDEITLEARIEDTLDVSALVVGIGGIGTYPTMVMQTSNLNWIVEVVAHEWIHNYFALRPLGLNYLTSAELRTMNETAAAIVGKEIGALVIERYYPELVPAPPEAVPSVQPPAAEQPPPSGPPPFDFQDEMRTTRVQTDLLLSQKRIAEAEAYMEARRLIFWENGYRIRRINQTYFAFYGAYADVPGGAAGEDPVGAAVRKLRQNSPDLRRFVQRIGWMWSFEQLQQAIAPP